MGRFIAAEYRDATLLLKAQQDLKAVTVVTHCPQHEHPSC